MEKDYSVTPEHLASLCNKCESILGILDEKWHPHHSTIQELATAAQSGCRLCEVHYQEAGEWVLSVLPPDKITQLQVFFRIRQRKGSSDTLLELRTRPGKRQTPSQLSAFYVLALNGDEVDTSHLLQSYEVPSSTGDPDVAALALGWLNECRSKHSSCREKSDIYFPPRLLDIRGQHIRLIIPDNRLLEDDSEFLYATLSHCWGVDRFSTLTEENLEDFQRDIPREDLPQNFRDAVEVCKRLGLKYLWIDSLCIIQSGKGSNRDWLHHLQEMRYIYGNCYVNIGASRAAAAADGLYTTRDSSSIRPIIVQNLSNTGVLPPDSYMLVHAGMPKRYCRDTPLSRRGWVFQERLLSPRVLYFGMDQVYWECSESRLQCETHPAGLPVTPSKADIAFKLPTRLDTRAEMMDYYNTLVNQYSFCQLTYPDTDKFPAFVGVAEHFAYQLQNDYVAGFYRNQLPECLMWRTKSLSLLPPIEPTLTYRCPSWSWAKANTAVYTYTGNLRRNNEQVPALSSVCDITISLVDPHNPYGRLKSAELVLRGRLVPFDWTPHELLNLTTAYVPQYFTFTVAGPINVNSAVVNWISFDSSDAAFNMPGKMPTYFLPIIDGSERHISGMLVRQVGQTTNGDKYERVGVAELVMDDIHKKLSLVEETDIKLV
jgi:hypothetical protein